MRDLGRIRDSAVRRGVAVAHAHGHHVAATHGVVAELVSVLGLIAIAGVLVWAALRSVGRRRRPADAGTVAPRRPGRPGRPSLRRPAGPREGGCR